MKLKKLIRYTTALLITFSFLFASCKDDTHNRTNSVASYEVKKEEQKEVIPGAERIGLYYPLLKDKKVALVVNHTSRVGERHLVDTLFDMKVDIKKVFAPEHGFRGNKSDGEKVEDKIDAKTGILIKSLYGKNKKPSKDDLNGIEVVVFDIQDVGVRFYTYLSTMHYVMEACAENNIKVIVLDRPNPHADYVDGPMLEPGSFSFIGLHPVPVVYGMTIGEYAKMINGEFWLKNKIKVDLEVIAINNYYRNEYYEIPIKPSPNLPNMTSILLYPSICFFEGTSVSVGRGTDKQFQVLGHPRLANQKFSFTPMPNEGSKYPPQEGKTCYGQDLSGLTLQSLADKNRIDLSYLLMYYKNLSRVGIKFFLKTNHFEKLSGSKKLKEQIIAGLGEEEIRESWNKDLQAFKKLRTKYLIYPLKDI